MRWHAPLYTGVMTRGKEEKIIKQTEEGNPPPGLMVITVCSNHRDLMDIRGAEWVGRKKAEDVPEIVGIALGETEAVSVVEKILQDCMREKGSVDRDAFIAFLDDGDADGAM